MSEIKTQAGEKIFENKINKTSEPNAEREWLSTEQAAAYLGISPATLRNLCSHGKVPYYKWQRCNRYRKDELRILLLATKQGGAYGY